MQKKKKGFTLAEVLITLAIIGVVAAMTIPSVIVRTNQQEFKTGAKKALSVLSSAVQLAEAQDSLTFSDGDKFLEALLNRMNVIKTEYRSYDSYLPGSVYAVTMGLPDVFYTADGFRYEVDTLDRWMAVFIVDVNGDKGPTTYDSSYAEATYQNEDDLYNPEWPNVRVTDVFYVAFDSDGRSALVPYTDGANLCNVINCPMLPK